MTRPARAYLVTNPGPVFGPGRRIVFRSAAPAGSVVRFEVDGRPVRALLTTTMVNGSLLGAELQLTYL
ncbi:hypothetical protein B9W64_37745 [Streptomyces sp. CS159]|uniref:hypothetical protein n=1 Tax=Streptomyces sp. CS159 TaxID=1982762 RepID=UPI000B40CED9|nr:hypothetical protein [Streptomyces sp. CS159]OVZ99539.1 hypothetical protein B9W64_37745 [Streptomyces sp. CS159]